MSAHDEQTTPDLAFNPHTRGQYLRDRGWRLGSEEIEDLTHGRRFGCVVEVGRRGGAVRFINLQPMGSGYRSSPIVHVSADQRIVATWWKGECEVVDLVPLLDGAWGPEETAAPNDPDDNYWANQHETFG
jgi:hypothetical protein